MADRYAPEVLTFSGNYTVDLSRAKLVVEKRGRPPEPTIVTSNPKYDQWLEGAALILCLEEENHVGVVPTPCSKHLSEARQVADHLLTTVTNGPVLLNEPRHTCTPGLIGSAYGCPVCMPETAPDPTKVTDLMAALEKSLEHIKQLPEQEPSADMPVVRLPRGRVAPPGPGQGRSPVRRAGES